jgi:hypothetical protein
MTELDDERNSQYWDYLDRKLSRPGFFNPDCGRVCEHPPPPPPFHVSRCERRRSRWSLTTRRAGQPARLSRQTIAIRTSSSAADCDRDAFYLAHPDPAGQAASPNNKTATSNNNSRIRSLCSRGGLDMIEAIDRADDELPDGGFDVNALVWNQNA